MEKINSPAPIAILMATYNGEKYLGEQIDSLLNQTYQGWHLYIHDDGSTDSTLSVIKEYAQHHPKKISLLDYPSQGGACLNFLSMLDHIEATYYMFCDQDDIWLSNKVEMELQIMKDIENNNPNKPIIINTDLTVVNAEKNTINESFWNYELIIPSWLQSYQDYAALHAVTGCTMLFNSIVKDVVKRPYNKAEMHDAWITLSVIASNGIVHYCQVPTILYRQHGNNTLGAKDYRKQTWQYKIKNAMMLFHINCIHFKQMNAIKSISLYNYIAAKIRYKKYIRTILNV